MPLPSIGGGSFIPGKGGICIKMFLHGHANRPFYHIIVTSKHARVGTHPVEQLGTYDPMPNKDNQRLLSLNVERTRYWMGEGATFSLNLAKVLGVAGFLPINHRTYIESWRRRYREAAEEEAKKAEATNTDGSGPSQPPSSSS